MYELEGMGESSENWTARLNELKEVIIHHVQEEENQVFEKSRNILSQQQAEDLLRNISSSKRTTWVRLKLGNPWHNEL